MEPGQTNFNPSPAKTEHIAVCLSSDPQNQKAIEKAASQAQLHNARFSAVYIKREEDLHLSEARTRSLENNKKLALSYGASLETLRGQDTAYLLSEYAKLYQVSELVVSQNTYPSGKLLKSHSVIEQFEALAPDVDVHIIPDHSLNARMNFRIQPPVKTIPKDLLWIAFIMLIATTLAIGMDSIGFDESSIIPIYTLAVLVASLLAKNWYSGITASLVSILLFNYLFSNPRYSLATYNSSNYLVYLVMLITSITIGLLVNRMKRHADQARLSAYRTRVLFDTNELLQMAKSESEIIDTLCQECGQIAHHNIVFYSWDGLKLGDPVIYTVSDEDSHIRQLLQSEQDSAFLCAQKGEITGKSTFHPGNARYLYIPCKTVDQTLGVLGIDLKNSTWENLESSIIQSILSKAALTLENIQLSQQMEEAKIQAKNEEMRSNMLRMVSHDLRTPLTSILGNVSNLMSGSSQMSEEAQTRIYKDIYENTTWLIKLVENLLSASRLEEGKIQIQTSPEILEEVINESLRNSARPYNSHTIKTIHDENYILVNVDASMIIRVLSNLLSNAFEYTQKDSTIIIHTYIKDDYAYVEVADDGPGIPDENKDKLFEMFYSGNKVSADSRKNLGLGLFLCKKIIEAHHGSIYVRDNDPTGSVFTFTLPLSDLSMVHE